jgi:iron(III) transport system substrate-binding protein
MGKRFTRRQVLAGTGAAAFTVYASPIRAAAPPAEAITPELIAAARKEGKVVWYSSIDL